MTGCGASQSPPAGRVAYRIRRGCAASCCAHTAVVVPAASTTTSWSRLVKSSDTPCTADQAPPASRVRDLTSHARKTLSRQVTVATPAALTATWGSHVSTLDADMTSGAPKLPPAGRYAASMTRRPSSVSKCSQAHTAWPLRPTARS